ncbi:MAG TPA: DNA mismatch repair protein MutS, partial [Bacteroidales bacterium]|nr:DNA mismatch repair protein MutS [Bacteroidales bacterium]
MKQYYSIKSKHPDAILLFRVGDFYETFGEDAIRTAEILGITLTRRANGSASFVELAGFPYHALDTYLPKLVRAGQRVAICEQLEDPKLTKKIVKRGITELVTPGVSLNDNVLDRKENNFLACVHLEKNMAGVAFLDISTGEFLTAEGPFEHVDKLLNSFSPKEVLVERSRQSFFKETFGTRFYLSILEDWVFTSENAREKLLKQFDTTSLKGFGIENLQSGIIASGAILQYLDITRHEQVKHITKLSRIDQDRYVWLDKFTVRNLELVYNAHEGGKTLIDIIDRTVSPMGSRLLKRWLVMPLKDVNAINERLRIVNFLFDHEEPREQLSMLVRQVGDLERLISKVAIGKISPREINQLKQALEAIAPLKTLCKESDENGLTKIAEQLNPCNIIRERIAKEIKEEAPVAVLKGNVIADGVSPELDELRKLLYSGKDYLAQVQQRESERTGIPSLKINFNNVVGYVRFVGRKLGLYYRMSSKLDIQRIAF